MTWMQCVVQDLRFGLRMLRRAPGFTATIIVTLALGIGMTSAVFGVFNAVLLRPLSYPDPERLTSVTMRDPAAPFPTEAVLGPFFLAWKEGAASFQHLVAYDLADEPLILDGAATRERVAAVSEGFWELSGARPVHGRLPLDGEPDGVLLSSEFFENRLRGDVSSIGKSIVVAGRPVTIVGVLPRGFPLQLPSPGWPGFEPAEIALYRTLRVDAPTGNQIQLLNVVGKLRDGVTIEQARAELETMRDRMAQARPAFLGNRMTIHVVPLSEKLTGHARLALGILLSAAVFVLLIACANVASLLFGRASARQQEMAIRAAIGAGRGRLFWQLLVESLMLGLASGGAGLVLARWFLSLILALAPQAMPRLLEASIDGSVLAFTLAGSLAAALLFGVGPSLVLGRVNLQHALRSGARSFSAGLMTPRAGKLLVAAEVALAIVLLTGAGLLVKSFWRLNAHPNGFEPQRVLTMQVELSGSQYDADSRRESYVREFLQRTGTVPGVSAVGISTYGETRTVALIEGAPVLPPKEMMQRSSVLLNAVSEGSARALGMRLTRGRWISDSGPVSGVVVNESVARRNFPSEEPIGRRMRVGGPDSPLLSIVGVVDDLKYTALDQTPEPEVYLSYSERVPWRFTAIIRTSLDPVALAPAVTSVVSEIDRALPVFAVRTLEQALADSIAPRRLNLFLLAVFAAAAIGLALTGIYSVVAYAVAHRTHEIGVRMALGADRRAVVGMVVRQGFGLVVVGIGIGLAAAMSGTRLMASLLYEVEPTDVQTFAVAAAGLALTALGATLVPAFKASRIDPAQTLR